MSANSDSAPAFYTVVSNDNRSFKFSEGAIKKLETLSTLIVNLGGPSGKPIPVENVDGKTMELVHKWCEHHKNDTEPIEEDKNGVKVVKMSKFDENLLKIDDDSLNDLISAANFLNAQDLLSVACKKVLEYVTDKSLEDVKTNLSFKSNEEEAAARL